MSRRLRAIVQRLLAAVAVIACVLTLALPASAQRTRRRFEPTDLRLQPPGTSELDLQTGIVTGEDGTRAFLPDFEASLGISSRLELEVDGAFGLDHLENPELLDHTLVALRVGIVDAPDEPGSKSAWSAGLQAGPRLPTLPHTHGVGFEALAIVGRTTGRMHLFAQAGTIVDPAEPVPSRHRDIRPFGVEGGLDLDVDLDAHEIWSITGEIGAVKFFSPQLDQLHIAAGPSLQVSSWLELSVIGLLGLLPGGDRYGGLLGANSRFKVF